ncbi:hypothetical protein [Chromobacterium haemolyticum]|uniref:hypothetical protein n=1 Tax=Chromobacterium haemolyticum TaxID=394935 RepID=UPI00174731FF|nr:hypothetical protein [Chromobacterium haemolyticum]QOD84834.1 hypothetical protein IEZ30_10300 [Chromobacterium haemolyticum]
MEKTSVKEISPCAIEQAFANILKEFTGKEWTVRIDQASFVTDKSNPMIRGPKPERIKLDITADEILQAPKFDSSIPF